MSSGDNANDPDDTASSLEPMTPEQATYLKALAGRLAEPDAFHETLTRAEAQKRIAALELRLARERRSGVDRLPHT